LSVVSVVCCTDRDHCDELDHASRGVLPTVVRRYVWSRSIVNE